jgi:thiamine biosynthesis lipoprotein
VSLVLLLGLLAGLSGCASQNVPNLQRYEFARIEMAIPFRVVLYAPSSIEASNAALAAFARIHELNGILSDYDSDSELSRLSLTSGRGTEVKVSDDLWNVLWKAQEISRVSEGAFDVTVGPIVNLWRKARRENKLPPSDLLAQTLARVGYTNLVLNARAHTAKLLHAEMRLDVGGIGKGYALDQALKVLNSHGLSRALVTGGGDMAVGDPPPGKPGWRIELPPLDVTNAPPAQFLVLRRSGFATSGDLFQRLEIDGKRYSHIVDPRTGIGLTDHSLVNIVAGDATTADALSKVVSVQGPSRGFEIAEKKDAAARVIRKPRDQIEAAETPRFRRFYE